MFFVVILIFFALITCGYIAGRDKNYVMYGLLPILVLLLSYNHLPLTDPSRKAVTEPERIAENDDISQRSKMLLLIGGTPSCAVFLGLFFRLLSSRQNQQEGKPA